MTRLKYILPLACVLALFGCTERIDLELNDDTSKRLVVDGWFTNQEKVHEVKLTWTSSFLINEEAEKVTGASLKITGPSGDIALTEVDPGVYHTPVVAGEIGESYTLHIDHEGEQYDATGYMREVAPIDSASVSLEQDQYFEDIQYYVVYINTLELPGLGDDYMWRTYVNGEPLRDSLPEIFFVTDQFYDGLYIENADIEYLETPGEAVAGDVVLIEQINMGRTGYEVLQGIMNETEWNGGLFDAPPANVATNLSNGALGYFGVAGVSTIEVVLPE